MIKEFIEAANEIVKSDFTLVVVLLIIIIALIYTVRKLYVENKNLTEAQTVAINSVATELAGNAEATRRMTKAMIIIAQTNPVIKESGIDLQQLFND